MRKVVVSEFVTLDGVMEAPNEWQGPFWHDDMGKYKFDELFASDALLLGRVTYEGFAAAWPSITDEVGFADRMNSLPKFVASTTLKDPTWNAGVIKGDVAEEIARLKQQPGQDILVYGSADLMRTLMQHDLVDEYRLMVHPVVVGSGKRLFSEGGGTTALQLVDTQTFPSGVIVLTYQPARQDAAAEAKE
jgi:dihydrofolate reductase